MFCMHFFRVSSGSPRCNLWLGFLGQNIPLARLCHPLCWSCTVVSVFRLVHTASCVHLCVCYAHVRVCMSMCVNWWENCGT